MDAAGARLMARYKQWANRLMLDAVAALPPGEAEKPRPSPFRNIVHTLNHILVIDRIWQAHIEGREHGYSARNTEDWPPLAELRAQQQAVDAWYVAWSEGLDGDGWARPVGFTLIGGNRGTMTCGEILLHLVTHASYHRGYVADMIYGVPGCRPPTLDLPVYMREAHAAV